MASGTVGIGSSLEWLELVVSRMVGIGGFLERLEACVHTGAG